MPFRGGSTDPDKPNQGFLTRNFNAAVGMGSEFTASRKDANREQPTMYNERLTTSGAGYRSSDPKPAEAIESSNSSMVPKKEEPERDEFVEADTDEEDQHLDEQAHELGQSLESRLPQPPKVDKSAPDSIKELVRTFIEAFPPPEEGTEVPKISMPIILPQRRPGSRLRGFVHAYAPVLEEAGITMEAFMSFHNWLDQSFRVSQAFNAVNAGCQLIGFITLAVPSPTINAIAQAIQMVDIAVQVSYIRYRTNDFIERMNEAWFMRYGLFAMIVTYKEDEPSLTKQVDIEAGTELDEDGNPKSEKQLEEERKARRKWEKQAENAEDPFAHMPERGHSKNPIRAADAETVGDINMPDPAPLIFPQIDEWVLKSDSHEPPKRGNKAFLSSYLDKRAQATFQKDHPESVLASTDVQWSSKMADPAYQEQFKRTHHMIIANMTGGDDWYSKRVKSKLQKSADKAARKKENSRRQNKPSLIAQGVAAYKGEEAKPRNQTGGLRSMRASFHEDALYLVIAPLPNEEEKQQIAEALEKAGVKGGNSANAGMVGTKTRDSAAEERQSTASKETSESTLGQTSAPPSRTESNIPTEQFANMSMKIQK